MSSDVKIGPRLRAARLAKGLTLEDVAAASGKSTGFVSRLERDQVSPSVSTLVSICNAVGLKVGELFETPTSKVVRADDRPEINFGGEGAREYLLSPGAQSHVEVIFSHIEPGGSAGDGLYSLESEVEVVFVLSGTLELTLGEERIELAQGDSAAFNGRDPHRWANASRDVPCEVLWILAPSS